MFQWLSYGNDPNSPTSPQNDKDFFSHREWSFTIEDDVYIRYQSFRDKEEMMAAIQKRQPHKIDIGAVFSACPKDHNTIKAELFHTVERELVFDIDMTDYDNIRTCCQGADICRRCWPYMTMAIKVLNRALKEDFAFEHITWFYSGRRGVHCWVCDPEARRLPNEARAAIVDYLSVQVGTAENSDRKLKSVFTGPLHPSLRAAYALLEPMFENYIVDDRGQGLLAKKENYIKVLNTLPSEPLRLELAEDWERGTSLSARDRWRQLRQATTTPEGSSATNNRKRSKLNYVELEAWRTELVFTHCYPRLDANVSKAQNHLLKSPFCIHPKTGRVCVPIDSQEPERFDPFNVPTVRTLCDEIDAYDKSHSGEDEVNELSKTSLRKSVDTFEKNFLRDLFKTIRKEMRDRAEQAAALRGDF
eukprot:scaffold249_cov109-Ochromonas_danica.AAC.7